MEKMKMHSPDMTQENIARIREAFPGCVTEAMDEYGKVKFAVDFDLLKQELSDSIVEGPQERYHLNWPGKLDALLTANAPVAKTMRPCREESVDFDTTKNLFIEGDNLDALKLLQETYLGKVKMIYIDPPYNTGRDFIYEDDFAESTEEFMRRSNQKDGNGNRLVANTESNGRFHSDWLSMMYPRLKLARNLLRDDGGIFISIDDGEQANLKRLCDEIFGDENYRNQIITRRRVKSLNVQFAENGLYSMNVGFEYILVYSKSKSFLMNALRMKKKEAPSKGTWNVFWSGADRPTMRYELLGFTPTTGQWRWSKGKAGEAIRNYQRYLDKYSSEMSLEEYWEKSGCSLKFVRRIPDGKGKNGGVQYWIAPSDTTLRTSNWIDIEVSQIRKEYNLPFDNPKNIELIKTIIELCNDKNSIILDFFSGSSTTSDAIMRLNAEDGGDRKFIMAQLPEPCNENSEAFKEGYKTIAELGKERIRQAGKKILAGECHGNWKKDVGFRVLKIDTSNMEDIYYAPDEIEQGQLNLKVDNVKSDRTSEDLLFQVLLDWGVDLTLPIRKEKIINSKGSKEYEVFFVDENALIACFDNNISEEFVKILTKYLPLRVVFRDTGFANDAARINVEQIFKQMSPGTEVKTI
jgi:adenine-specific DNA-methyltransferase